MLSVWGATQLGQCPYAFSGMSSEEFKNQKNKTVVGREIGGDDDVVSISSLLKLGVAPASVFICASWRQGWLGGMATVVAKWVPGPNPLG